MSRTLVHTVTADEAGRRVRGILQGPLGLSAGLVTRLKHREGAVRLNGAPVRTVDPVAAGDELTVDVGDTAVGRFQPMAVPLRVLWEDADLLIVDKPAGMATHGRVRRGEATVGNAVAAYLGTAAPFHPVNRLDRGTSGVLCAAKTGYAHNRLRLTLHTENFRRTYLALAVGTVIPAAGVIDLPIGRTAEKKFGVRPDGAPSVTRYETLASADGLTLLRVLPETGRTHQIRVHFAALGYPLLGDRLYGRPSEELGRPALHSAALTLTHPVTGVRVAVSAPLPADFLAVLCAHGLPAPENF